jgi:hypothetical protein
MSRNRKPQWAWCDQCDAWIGPQPPLEGQYWPVEKSAAMHRAGTHHKVRMVPLADLLPIPQA